METIDCKNKVIQMIKPNGNIVAMPVYIRYILA